MIAKVIAWGRDRAEALARLRRALREMTVVRARRHDEQVVPARPARPPRGRGRHRRHRLARPRRRRRRRASAGAATPTSRCSRRPSTPTSRGGRGAGRRFLASARRGRPRAGHDGRPHASSSRHRGQAYRLTVASSGRDRYRVVLDGRTSRWASTARPAREPATVGGRALRVVVAVARPPDHLVEVDGVAHRVSRDDGGRGARPGARASWSPSASRRATRSRPASRSCVLESMKMEIAVTAPVRRAWSREVLVAGERPGRRGAPLLRMEPVERGRRASAGDRASAVRASPPRRRTAIPRPRASEILGAIRRPAPGLRRQRGGGPPAGRRVGCAARRARRPTIRRCCRARSTSLGVFADLAELSRDRAAGARGASRRREGPQPSRALPHLPALAGRRARGRCPSGSAPRWRGRWGTTASTGLDRSPDLAEAVYRHLPRPAAGARQVPGRDGLLDRRCATPTRSPPRCARSCARTLDRLVAATQLRHPAIGELARGVRFRCFDRPVHRARPANGPTAGVRDRLVRLAASPDAPRRRASASTRVVASLAAAPADPRRSAPANGHDRPEAMLEVLTRRYYKIRDLRDLRLLTVRRAVSSPPPPRAAPAGDVRLVTAMRPRSTTSTAVARDRRAVRAAIVPDAEGASPTSTSRWPGRPTRTRWPTRIGAALIERGAPCPPRCGASPCRWCSPDGEISGVHLPPRRRASARGAGGPRAAPDDLAAAALLAARQLRGQPAAVGQGHLPLPLRRAGEPGRRAVRGPGRGPRPDAGP